MYSYASWEFLYTYTYILPNLVITELINMLQDVADTKQGGGTLAKSQTPRSEPDHIPEGSRIPKYWHIYGIWGSMLARMILAGAYLIWMAGPS